MSDLYDGFFDPLYAVNDEDYSPEVDGYIDAAQAVPVVQVHRQSPFNDTQPTLAPVVPAPPSPSVGGEPGNSLGVGWSTGIRNSRAFRQPFDGRTLVVPNMGAHPVSGPVGFSTRTDRLVYNARATESDNMVDNKTVTEEFANPNVAAIAYATAGNPNYG